MSKTPELFTYSLTHCIEDVDYKIMTEDVYDEDSQEYLSLHNALKVKQLDQIVIRKHIPQWENEKKVFKYELDSEATLDLSFAKMCGFGVLEIINGNNKGKQYMFPRLELNDEEIQMHLIVYGVLKHNHSDELTLRKLIKDVYFRKYMKDSLNLCTFDFYDCSNPYYYMIEELAELDEDHDWLLHEEILVKLD